MELLYYPSPQISLMLKWCVLLLKCLHHCFFFWGGGGGGLIVPIYFVQDCRVQKTIIMLF